MPPDAFSETGQLWGSPLYRWPEHHREDYQWWSQRIGRAGQARTQTAAMIAFFQHKACRNHSQSGAAESALCNLLVSILVIVLHSAASIRGNASGMSNGAYVRAGV